MSKCRVFVYGTLRRGFGNHILLKSQRFLGEAITSDRAYVMIDSFGLPFVIKAPKNSSLSYYIAGELYEVDMPTLGALDTLESNGYLYKREKIRTSRGKAWIYLGLTGYRHLFGKIKPEEDLIVPANSHGIQFWYPKSRYDDEDDIFGKEDESIELADVGEEIPFEPTEEKRSDSPILTLSARAWTGR